MKSREGGNMRAEEVARECVQVHQLRKGARYVLFVDETSGVNVAHLGDLLEEYSKGTIFVVGVRGKPSDVLNIIDVGEIPGV